MEETARKQLQKYINFQPSSVVEMATALINPGFFFNTAIPNSLKRSVNPNKTSVVPKVIEKSIRVYSGENPFVLEMMDFLLTHLSQALAGAYVHGSLGTYEEVAYSDFDALVIIKDDVVRDSKRLAQAALLLHKSRHIMQRFDPLQHHGWFVLTESDLEQYPQTYFPHELFDQAKSLFFEQGLQLKLQLDWQKHANYRRPLKNLTLGLIRKIEQHDLPQTMYKLKGLTSEFMLLPALYIQAKTGKGIYKRESFPEAKKDFSDAEWWPMEEVSQIRKDWHYEMSSKERQKMISLNPLMVRRKKESRPAIPPDIAVRLTPEFFEAMKQFCHLLDRKIT